MIALRAVPTVLYGKPVSVTSDLLSILDIKVDNYTMTDAVEAIVGRMDDDEPGQVSFVNADCANIAYREREYLKTLNHSWITLADGIGMKVAGKLLKREIRQNVNGTDLFPRLCEALSDTGKGIFLLGARPGIADCVRDWVAEHHPGVIVSGSQYGRSILRRGGGSKTRPAAPEKILWPNAEGFNPRLRRFKTETGSRRDRRAGQVAAWRT